MTQPVSSGYFSWFPRSWIPGFLTQSSSSTVTQVAVSAIRNQKGVKPPKPEGWDEHKPAPKEGSSIKRPVEQPEEEAVAVSAKKIKPPKPRGWDEHKPAPKEGSSIKQPLEQPKEQPVEMNLFSSSDSSDSSPTQPLLNPNEDFS